jgi:hypothetical protein
MKGDKAHRMTLQLDELNDRNVKNLQNEYDPVDKIISNIFMCE